MFNLSQTNIEIKEEEKEATKISLKERFAELLNNFPNKPTIIFEDREVIEGEKSAYYCQEKDKIFIPKKEAFETEERFYITLIHELSHSTRHKSRLARGFESETEQLIEELSAEISSFMIRADLGITEQKNKGSRYAQNMLKILSKTNDLEGFIAHICKTAVKSASHIMGIEYNS